MKRSPRFLGINLLTPTYHIATSILEEIDPKITVIAGGAHADALPMEVMNDPAMKKISFLVLGDGEYKMESLLGGSYKSENIPGVVFRRNGKIMIDPDQPLDDKWTPRNLDELPFIDRQYLGIRPLLLGGKIRSNYGRI